MNKLTTMIIGFVLIFVGVIATVVVMRDITPAEFDLVPYAELVERVEKLELLVQEREELLTMVSADYQERKRVRDALKEDISKMKVPEKTEVKFDWGKW